MRTRCSDLNNSINQNKVSSMKFVRSSIFFLCFILLCNECLSAQEPLCTTFSYYEQLLEKMVRMEFNVNNMEKNMLATEKNMLETQKKMLETQNNMENTLKMIDDKMKQLEEKEAALMENIHAGLAVCRDPPMISNGKIEVHGQDYSVAFVRCDNGYLASKEEIACQTSGKWEDASCADVDECESSPCHNGTCIDGTNGYICVCNDGFYGTNCEQKKNPSDCVDLQDEGKTEDGVYTVRLWNSSSEIQVYCDMTTADGGWTVFQNRFNGAVDFYRMFAEYENGFGDLNTEFWLGLKYIKEMADQGTAELRIDLQAANDTRAYETFSSFSLSNGTQYKLLIGPTSSISNILDESIRQYHNGHAFSTYDRDLDDSSGNCAVDWHGAWWYKDCHKSNLNGQYLTPGSKSSWKGIVYDSFSYGESLKASKMMLRRVK